MQTIETNEIAIIENSLDVIKRGPEILLANKERARKAIEVGNNILAAIASNEGVMTPELDARAMNYLANIGKAVKEMKEGRAEVTQIMDELKKMFTACENEIDAKKVGSVPARVQTERDGYARQVFEANERKRKAAELEAQKAKESIEIKKTIAVRLSSYFNEYLLKQKQKVQNAFNALVLKEFAEDAATIRMYKPEYKIEHFNLFAHGVYSGIHTAEELKALQNEAVAGKYEEFAEVYISEMTELRNQIVDQIPSKHEELLEAKRLADEQAAEAERQRLAEEKRKAEMAKANAATRKRLEAQAEIDRAAEAKKNAELAEEQKKADEAKKKREAEEAARLAKEAEEANSKAEQEAEIKKQGEQTMVLFDQEAALADATPTTEARQGYEITVLHAAGYVQIFQFWFEREGKKLTVDKMGNTKLMQMKAFVEKVAHATGEKIESKFLHYTESFKAVNRKSK